MFALLRFSSYRAMFLLFGIAGTNLGVWASYLPRIKERFDLSERELSYMLLCFSAVLTVSTLISSRWVSKLPTQHLALFGAGSGLAMMPFIYLAPSYWMLFPLSAALAISVTFWEIAMNKGGVDEEERRGVPLISGLHGVWALGAMVGALLAATANGAGFPPWLGSLLYVAPALALVLALIPKPLAETYEIQRFERDARETPPPLDYAQVPLLLWALSLVGMLAVILEIGYYDWSAIYLENERNQSEAQAVLAVAATTGGAAAARFAGDWLTTRMGRPRLLLYSSLVGLMGLVLALLGPDQLFPISLLGLLEMDAALLISLLGFFVIGLGFANFFPVLVVAAARVPGLPHGVGLTLLTGIMYGAGMAGPVLIGFLAEEFWLELALLLVGGFFLIIGPAGYVLVARSRAKPTPPLSENFS